ncbi:MAG: hypothetical protein ACK40G_02715 [Cytophagaceae bacterium]
MKAHRLILFSIIFFMVSFASAQEIRGLYVSTFSKIINNPSKEDSLLNYAKSNGFNYLLLYELNKVNTAHNLTNVNTSAPLANFIRKAKEEYGIMQVGAIGERFLDFKNHYDIYNDLHPDQVEKFDVYNLEMDFWNPDRVAPDDYSGYCSYYLSPSGLPCDTAGGFSFYKEELRRIDSLCKKKNVICETKIGYQPNEGQCRYISLHCDRILLLSFMQQSNQIYPSIRERLVKFAAAQKSIQIIPTFSSESFFMGDWLKSNNHKRAYEVSISEFNKDAGLWKQYIKIVGHHWYDYESMVYDLIVVSPTVKHNVLTPDGDGIDDNFFINENGIARVFNSQGHLVKEFNVPDSWDGTDQSGNFLNSDYYLIKINENKIINIYLIR